MNVVIVGAGYVGQAMKKIFPEANYIDPAMGWLDYEDPGAQRADLAIICVPTPMNEDGSCDTSIVSEAISKLNKRTLVVVKSTVPPGTCAYLSRVHGRGIVFSPEYIGESRYWTPPQYPQPDNPLSHGFMILGGPATACEKVADIFITRLGPATRFRFMASNEAELVKYAENAFFSVKVTFANLLRRICETEYMNYHAVREGWIDDPRVGPMHTAAFKDAPGFAGKCLPKDTAALAAFCRVIEVDAPILDAVLSMNEVTK